MTKLKAWDVLLKEAIEMLKAHFVTYLGIVAVPSLFFIAGSTGLIPLSLFIQPLGVLGYFAGMALLTFVLLIFSSAALLYAIKDKSGVARSYGAAVRHMGGYLLVGFLAGIAVLGGFLLLFIPGVIFTVWFMFSLLVFVFEGKTGTDALKASKALVSGRWWGVFGRTLLIGALFAGEVEVLGIRLDIPGLITQAVSYVAGASIVTVIFYQVLRVLGTLIFSLFVYRPYLNLRETR